MATQYHYDVLQRTEEWSTLRCGLLTASQFKLLVTEKTLKATDNDKVRGLFYELAAQRIQQMQTDGYQSWDMLRGEKEEVLAKDFYAKHYQPVKDCGFITNDDLGFKIGMSPDGLVGEDGGIEVKSCLPKFQVETILGGKVPGEHRAQVEGCFLVTGRKWWDFVSYSNGMHMGVIHCEPTTEWQQALTEACKSAEAKIVAMVEEYKARTKNLHLAPFVDVMADMEPSNIKPSSNQHTASDYMRSG